MDPTPHGYNINDTVVYSKDGHQLKLRDLAALQCPLCELVLRDPVQVITCGHRFCKDCLDLKTSARYVCFQCSVLGGRQFKKCIKKGASLLPLWNFTVHRR